MDYAAGKIIVGAIFLFAAFYLYGVFQDLATGARESFRVNWFVAIAYNNLGPTLTLIILVLVGVAAILFGVLQLIRERGA